MTFQKQMNDACKKLELRYGSTESERTLIRIGFWSGSIEVQKRTIKKSAKEKPKR